MVIGEIPSFHRHTSDTLPNEFLKFLCVLYWVPELTVVCHVTRPGGVPDSLDEQILWHMPSSSPNTLAFEGGLFNRRVHQGSV